MSGTFAHVFSSIQSEEKTGCAKDSVLAALIGAAVRAPSGDNTQPWRFVFQGDNRIAVHVDETRDRSPMNAGQRMARIACGAAIENMLQTADARGWRSQLESGPGPALSVITFHTNNSCPKGEASIEESIVHRVTNRQRYDGRPVPANALARLGDQTPVLEGARTHWISGQDRIVSLAAIISRADAVMFGEKSLRRAFLSQVRFDALYHAEVEEGLSLACLEVSTPEIMSMRTVFRGPDWIFKVSGAPQLVASHARKLVASASGLCLVVLAEGSRSPYHDLLVGRAMQRAWLALEREGLAVQPMMSLLVLENLLEHGDSSLSPGMHEQSAALLKEFRRLVPEVGAGRPAFLLRFGFAPTPSGRTGRRPVSAVYSG